MRFGVISDVHGNLHALRATVSHLRRQGVDGWLSVGDLIGYGPHPNECVEMLAELGAAGVAGNHELIALGELSGVSSSERARRSHRWTAAELHEDVVAYLAGLPRRVEIAGGVLLTHGSLDDPEEYVNTVTKATHQLAQLAREHPTARLLVLGNTHRQQLCSERGGSLSTRSGSTIRLDVFQRHLANPGSVGQSRQWEWPPPARAMVLDVNEMTVEFHRIPYDVRAGRLELARHGLPYRSLQAPPPLRSVASRRLRRVVYALKRRP
ncbi:MAG: metallophosphatase family protein [Actinomycetota bacterium]|nr:metallophosphatase family protein [Actinomycetota bacterium]